MKPIIFLLLLYAQAGAASFTDSTGTAKDSTANPDTAYHSRLFLTKTERREMRMPHYWAKQRKIAVQALVGGWFDGENHFLRNNFEYYLDRWPGTNPQWSNPRLSAYNKYKDGKEENGPAYTILGLRSDKALAFTTDKWHLNEFLDMLMLAGCIGVSITLYRWPRGVKWYRVLGRAATEGFIVHFSHSVGKALCFQFYGVH